MSATAASLDVPLSATPESDGILPHVDALLRRRGAFLSVLEDEASLAPVARAMLAAVVACTAVAGAVMGLHRGGWQVLFAATKLPLGVLLTAGLVAPVLSALRCVERGRADLRRDFALVLAALAFGSTVLVGLTPVLVLATLLDVGYHDHVMLAVGCCATGGTAGFSLLWKGLRTTGAAGRRSIAIVLVACALVGTRMTWTLRPFFVRPRSEVVFLRPLEGTFGDSVWMTFDSARGVFHRESAPLPGEE